MTCDCACLARTRSRDVQLFAPDIRASGGGGNQSAYRDNQEWRARPRRARRLEGLARVATVQTRRHRRPRALHVQRHRARATHDRVPHRPRHHRRQNLRHVPPGNPLRTHPAATPPAPRAGQGRVPRPANSRQGNRLSARRGRPHGGKPSKRWATTSRR